MSFTPDERHQAAQHDIQQHSRRWAVKGFVIGVLFCVAIVVVVLALRGG